MTEATAFERGSAAARLTFLVRSRADTRAIVEDIARREGRCNANVIRLLVAEALRARGLLPAHEQTIDEVKGHERK
jgi:hypothetical protein